jgi:hypothetical protein
MNRQEANREILKKIEDMVENQPELRFHQILFILGINKNITDVPLNYKGRFVCEDLFAEESIITLEKINKK